LAAAAAARVCRLWANRRPATLRVSLKKCFDVENYHGKPAFHFLRMNPSKNPQFSVKKAAVDEFEISPPPREQRESNRVCQVFFPLPLAQEAFPPRKECKIVFSVLQLTPWMCSRTLLCSACLKSSWENKAPKILGRRPEPNVA
jgi:hypothetical protein